MILQLGIIVESLVEAHGRVTGNCELNIYRKRTSVRLYKRNLREYKLKH